MLNIINFYIIKLASIVIYLQGSLSSIHLINSRHSYFCLTLSVFCLTLSVQYGTPHQALSLTTVDNTYATQCWTLGAICILFLSKIELSDNSTFPSFVSNFIACNYTWGTFFGLLKSKFTLTNKLLSYFYKNFIQINTGIQ